MTGRSLAMTLAAWGCGLATPCLAQTYAGPPATSSSGYGAPGDVVTLPPEAGGYSYSSGAFGDDPAMGGYGTPAYCPPPGSEGAYCPPEPEPWWKQRRCLIDKRWLKPPRGAFVRTEYLLWEIEEPGTEFLGEPFPADFAPGVEADFDDRFLDIDFNPEEGFLVFDQQSFNLGSVYVPTLDEIQLRDNSGVRVTFGIPTYEYGTIELSGWALEQASDHYEFGPKQADFTNFFGTDFQFTPTTSAINPGDFFVPNPAMTFANDVSDVPLVIGFDQLNTVYTSDMLGADVNFVVDALAPQGEGLKFKPLFGFKYVGLQEFQSITGFGSSPFTPAFGGTLTSDTDNTYLGGTIGLRTEFVHRWFVLGVQPAATFSGNIARAKVKSSSTIGFQRESIETESDYYSFAPILDLKAYVRVCLSENWRLNVGYDAFWLAKAYRASDVIDYRVETDGGTTQLPASRTQRRTDDIAVEGLSVGIEYVF